MKFLQYFFPFLLFCSCSQEISKDLSSYKETFGCVNGVTNNKHIYYTVKDVNYKSDFDRSYYGEIDNEKYSLKYDSLNPESVVINYIKPIFVRVLF